MLNKPLVGVTADTAEIGMHPSHVVGDKYLHAVIDGAAATAVIVPALGAAQASADLVAAFDGLLFTGSASNVDTRLSGVNGPSCASRPAMNTRADT